MWWRRGAGGRKSEGQGGPVLAGSGDGEDGADSAGAAGQLWASGRNGRFMMSLNKAARLPPCRVISRLSCRHSGWLGRMRRSRQMSAMTAPIGRRRTQASICSGVGKCARSGSVTSVRCTAGLAGRGLRAGWSAAGLRPSLQAYGIAEHSCFERVGTAQATGDACDDERNIAGAEPPQTGGRVGGGVVTLEGGGEFLTVIDEPADEREEAADAAGLVRGGGIVVGLRGRVGDGRCGGHEHNKNTGHGRCQGIFSVSGDTASRFGHWFGT